MTGVPAGIAGVIVAFLLAGSADIAFIDWIGGNHGVYFAGTWWGIYGAGITEVKV